MDWVKINNPIKNSQIFENVAIKFLSVLMVGVVENGLVHGGWQDPE